MQEKKFINIGLISISDRASQGIYKDEGIPSLKTWLAEALNIGASAAHRATNAGKLRAPPEEVFNGTEWILDARRHTD